MSIISKIKKDPYILGENLTNELINLYIHTRYFILKILSKYSFLKKNEVLKNIFLNKKVIILGNGPSTNDYDLKKLKNQIVIMVNRSFNHKDYEIIRPKFHIIVDPKLANGMWPIEYVHTIFRKNPEVNLVLNADWYYLEKFNFLKNKKNVYWVKSKNISYIYNNFSYNLTKLFTCAGVIGNALCLSIYTGSKEIYFLGMELNGVIKLLANQESHFNGKDQDYSNHSILDWSRDLGFNSRGLRYWHRIHKLCKEKNIKLINLTKKGLFNFVINKNFDEIF